MCIGTREANNVVGVQLYRMVKRETGNVNIVVKADNGETIRVYPGDPLYEDAIYAYMMAQLAEIARLN